MSELDLPKPFFSCHTHLLDSEVWVICTHTDVITIARFIHDEPLITGEALCGVCQKAKPALRHPDLRLACGSCVRARWPIEGKSAS